jgi:flagellar export protein FliJ
VKFRFRLAKLRRVRALQEDAARVAWAEAVALARVAEQAAAQRAEELESARRFLARERASRTTRPALLLAYEQALWSNEAAARRARERAVTLSGQADRLRTPYEQRRSDRKALDNLHDREREEHEGELRRREQLALDEIVSARDARSGRKGDT